MFLVSASAGPLAGVVLFSMLASLLVSERYSSITSGTRRTALDPTSNFEGGGGGGGGGAPAGADDTLFSLSVAGDVEVGGLGGGLGALPGLSFVNSDSRKSCFKCRFSTAGLCCPDKLTKNDGFCWDTSILLPSIEFCSFFHSIDFLSWLCALRELI